MALKEKIDAKEDALNQVAGITGFGWTAALLGYFTSVLGYSSTFITNPQSLLYLGGVLFVTTLGLDRLIDIRSNGEE